MPLISVILPVYNGASTIQDTIASVLAQTWTDFELLIVNDGSTDDTLALVERLRDRTADSRLRVVSFPNAGSNPTRNRGIDLATGTYISFIDADDLWTPEKLADQLAALRANPKAAVAYSWTDCIDASGQFLRPGPHATLSGDLLPNLLLTDFIGSGSNVLLDRAAAIAVGKFDETLPNAQDWDMWLRLAARYEFACVPKVQVLYRVSGESLSSNVERMAAASFQVIDRAFAQAPAHLQVLKPHSLGNRYKFLTFRALQSNPRARQGWLALGYLLQAVRYDPALLRTRLLVQVLLKIGAIVLLPPAQAQALLQRRSRWFTLYGLLARMHIHPETVLPRSVQQRAAPLAESGHVSP